MPRRLTYYEAAARYSARHFGRADAAPKIIGYYTPRGWRRAWDKSLRLTPEACFEIRARHGVMVKVRHRFRTTQVQLARYLGEDRWCYPYPFGAVQFDLAFPGPARHAAISTARAHVRRPRSSWVSSLLRQRILGS